MRLTLARALAVLRPSANTSGRTAAGTSAGKAAGTSAGTSAVTSAQTSTQPITKPPGDPPGHSNSVPLDAVSRTAERCRQRVTQRALLAAGVAMVPVPGVDWITDVGLLVKLLPEITTAFGLSPAQVERLAPERRVVVYKALSAGSSLVLGRVVTRELVIAVLKTVGLRLSTQQAAKYLPVAGQLLSAALTYSALKFVCEQHIRQCEAVARQLLLSAPVTVSG